MYIVTTQGNAEIKRQLRQVSHIIDVESETVVAAIADALETKYNAGCRAIFMLPRRVTLSGQPETIELLAHYFTDFHWNPDS